ncbi:hypothetical protein N7462_008274 [Penicillium macrosclerotiorum]|uniref:uncharacterized protein n=1 Tax=Penicillium macrosclerotiorum TaxID=303699 RepID=UPI0025488B3B|nr:uncharacterized protein N7462_008274 [Penicillium macrosclerotiorum]KAJ5675377.1 hypothetical protein N7462_008274 [Penicillium macrosclerotiorum]
MKNRDNYLNTDNTWSLTDTKLAAKFVSFSTEAEDYCHVGTTNTGIFKEHETELILAAALAGSGATRSATVHGKTTLALGNSPEAVRAVYKLAEEINVWNRMPYQPVDLGQLLTAMGL